MPDLSVLIPARSEMFLRRTVEDVLAHRRGATEVIVVLDGEWSDPPLDDLPGLKIIYLPKSIGQRAATNLAARASGARYVMKLDAHCSVAEGFDVELTRAGDELGPDVTQIPAMYNLHAFNWRCRLCGNLTYQGPTLTACSACKRATSAADFERVITWDLKAGKVEGREKRTEFWRFDCDLHFQYDGPRSRAHGPIEDVMSSVGACFFMRRDRFWQLGGLDERHGSWGQFGTEISCKSWLSGGRQVVNKQTWYAHLFRTQGGDFSFPYANPQRFVDGAREHSRRLWLGNTWPGQVRPLAWLVDHFAPIVGWQAPERNPKGAPETEAQQTLRERRLREVREAALRFRAPGVGGPTSAAVTASPGPCEGGTAISPPPIWAAPPTKGLVYYTDCRGDARILEAVRRRLRQVAGALPIVSVTLGPVDLGRNIVLDMERGYLAMFRQILAGLEALETDVAFLVEHDVLYHPTHFEFTPPRRDVFYYNRHTWKVDAETGRAVHYLCDQTSGLCADRALLIAHYRKRVALVETAGYDRNLGFEPGTNKGSRAIDPEHGSDSWMSSAPNVDIRHGFNLTRTRWSPEQFRNKSTCQGWTEGDTIPGWGPTLGRFDAFLAEAVS